MSESIHGLDAEDPDAPLEPADVETWDTEVEVGCPLLRRSRNHRCRSCRRSRPDLCRGLSGVLSAVAGTPQLR